MKKRQPIVTVLGHVDHGKTTLLDAIRKTTVASSEAGGITQKIGASIVDGITFIDTPGHAIFSKMRSRGAKVADIALLVVAQDDGVKPQTKEAIQIIKEVKIPFIVVGTKSDVAGVSPERLQGELEKEEVFFEGRGGETPFISISAKANTGITELLEMIKLVSEVNNISGDEKGELEAVVIESFTDKRGVVANVIVRNGSLSVGEETTFGKIRALFNEAGRPVKEIGPGFPVQIIGFTKAPEVGAALTKGKPNEVEFTPKKVLGLNRRLQDDEVPIVLKAESAGAIEAILASLPPKVVVLDSGVGDVNESDIATAKVGKGYVFAFGSKISANIIKIADSEAVKVKRFEIVYELLMEIEEIFKKGKVEILGRAKVIASFPFNDKKVAGCKVVDGHLNKTDRFILTRDEKEIGKIKITSMKKGKIEVGSVGQGEEFGAILEPQLDFQVGDMIVSIRNG